MYFVVAFLLLSSCITADDTLAKQPISIIGETAPCSIVNDSVNVVDGSLCLQFHHLRVPGHVPLDLVQYYNSKSNYSTWFGTGMSLNYSFAAWTARPGHKKRDKDEEYNETIVESAGGSIIRCLGKYKYDSKATYFLDPEVTKDGFTNCSGGILSARTNLKNISFVQDTKHGQSDWASYMPDGTIRYYHRVVQDPLTYVYLETRPNGTRLLFDYDYYKEFRNGMEYKKVDSIKRITAKAHNTMNWLAFSEHHEHAKITSSNGKTVRFELYDNDFGDYIRKIESSDNPTITLSYKDVGEKTCINKLSWPQGRFLKVEYDHKGRVITQKAPVGKGNEKHTIYSFEYHSDNTVVTNANNHKKKYVHKHDRITSIEDINYRSKHYYWGTERIDSWKKPPTGNKGNLLGSATLNNEGCGVSSCYYDYDEHGNIVSETVCGNLTGTYPWAFWIDDSGKPKDPNIQQYQKYYKYSDKHLLIEQTEDEGPSFEYDYKEGTDLLIAKYTKDKSSIIQREFYEYDENSILRAKIVDDGNTKDKSSLSGITERHFTQIKPVSEKEGFGQGLPEDIWEKYFDLSIGEYRLLKHTHYDYNKAGEVVEESTFDANDQKCYSTQYEYNHKGLLHKKIDPVGNPTTITYDENLNKQYEKQENTQFHTKFHYDNANRLTEVIEYHYDDTKVRTAYEYDFMGNKTASIDRYGQKTYYDYDPYNRVTKICFPDGTTIQKEYDIFDNVIKEVNQNGAVTTYAYTIRNAPTLISYPDGSTERFEYNKNGTLANKWDQCGTKTSYEYDILGRVTKTSLFDGTGSLLSTASNTYNSFHLISTTDAMGYTTFFTYDQAGRKIEEYKEDETNYGKTAFEYDALGRIATTKKYFGPEKNNFIATCREYDNLGRVIIEANKDEAGYCIDWNYYVYDARGNCTLKRTGYLEEGNDADLVFIYNSKCECTSSTDECKNTTNYTYHHAATLQKTTQDALNNSTEEHYDISGRLTSLIKKNPQGELTAACDFYYNGTGKKVKQVEKVVIDGIIDHEYVISWCYDTLDRIESVCEQEEKTTYYSYDPCGRIKTITKPDGTTLSHYYDALGRLIMLNSSDKTISYSYVYDLHNNPLESKDSISGLTTRRTYDAWDRLTSDGLDGIHKTSYSYDALGRITTLTAPDNSSISYNYQNGYLCTIERNSPSSSITYTHSYLSYDKKGRVLESSLICDLGTAHFSYDKKGRNIALNTNHYSHTIPEDGFDAVGNLKTYHFTDHIGKSIQSYCYDDLYQLTSESGSHNHTYAHDSINNRLSKNSSKHSIDSLNKITTDGKAHFTYDKNGNLIADESLTYRYDALDRLIQANDTHYIYDSFNRRIKKDDTYFLHQNLREIGTLYNDSIQEFRVLGLGKGAELGASIAIELANNIYCPLHDFRGNIVALIDTKTAQPAETYRYTAFGECEVQTHTSLPYNPWRFASKRYDPETGFTYFLHRYYNPNLGRWITPDPLGFADGPNIYAYVHNNPLARVDFYGLFEYDEYNDFDGAGLYGMLEATFRTTVDFGSFAGYCIGGKDAYHYIQNWHNTLDEMRDRYANAVATGGTVSAQEMHQAIAAGMFARETLDLSRMGFNLSSLALKNASTTLNLISKETKLYKNAAKQSIKEASKTEITKEFINDVERLVATDKTGLMATKSTISKGNQIHKAYKINDSNGVSRLKEHRLPSGKRVDFLDRENGIIYELKPNNPNGIRTGKKQLDAYKKELDSHPFYKNTEWKTKLETY